VTSQLPARPVDEVVPHGSPPRTESVSVFLGVCALAGLVQAVVGGWLWTVLAHPPSAPVTADGVFLTEQGLNQQTLETGWFMVVGLGVGALSGLAVGLLGRRLGWQAVVGVLVLCAVGSVGAAWVGQDWLAPSPQHPTTGAVGHVVHFGVTLGSNVAYLSWPVGGLLGCIAAIATWSNERKDASAASTSSNVIAG
jgi:hypothetical protein